MAQVGADLMKDLLMFPGPPKAVYVCVRETESVLAIKDAYVHTRRKRAVEGRL